MRAGGLPLLPLLAACAMSQPLPVSVRHPPGIDVSAPRFVAGNDTWQFEMLLVATDDVLLVPLFTDPLDRPGPLPAGCEGLVSLCCLRVLSTHLRNARFATYVNALGVGPVGACVWPTDRSSREVLAGRPSEAALQRGVFGPTPIPGWCVDAHRCVNEASPELLRYPWFSKAVGESTTADGRTVVDREIEVVIAIVTATTTPLVQITLSRYTLLFHDVLTPAVGDPNVRHHVFSHVCREAAKPERSLWRADVLTRGEPCLWFCEPGFVLHPATTDAGLRAGLRPYGCVRQPARATVLSFDALVALSPAPDAEIGLYHAEALTALQAALEDVLHLRPGMSVFHLQRVLPDGGLQISAAVFLPECPRNQSALEEEASGVLRDASTVALFSELLREAFTEPVSASNDTGSASNATGQESNVTGQQTNETGAGVESFRVSGVETVSPCPTRVPLLLIVTAVVWAALLCVFCFYGAYSAVRRLRERRARILRRLGAVAQPAFRVRP